MYVSPLIDENGEQTGWMASMTDVTEPNRIRRELAAAHDRFNTVLDELGAAVLGCAAAPRSRRCDEPLAVCQSPVPRVFGSCARGHRELLTGGPPADDWVEQEVYVARADRWFEVRSRQILWVDGDPVHLVVATDITAAHHVRELQEQQDEQLQQNSRLVTMGEMASSIAHELNQPLAAISNYASGLAARFKRCRRAQDRPRRSSIRSTRPGAGAARSGGDPPDSRLRQAQRARTAPRARRRDPRRRRRPGRDRRQAPAGRDRHPGRADLPICYVDPILIEQVLINLLKNGVDAMKDPDRGAS